MRGCGALVFFLVAAPFAATAAPTRRAPPNAAASTPARTPSTIAVGTAAHAEGQYGGVTPGEPAAHDASATKPKHLPAKGTLTWIGFAAKDGGAEVFFQSVAPCALRQRVEGGSLIVHLDLPRLGHNTWRQVDTRFFDNPLAGIVARTVSAVRATKAHPARAAGIEAKIAFKNAKDAKDATVRTVTEADGMYYAYLTFGEGTEAVGPGDAPPPAIDAPEPSREPSREPTKEPTKEPSKEPAEAPPAAKEPAKPTRPQKQEPDSDQPPDLPKSK
jgi:hypothetical protein